MMFYISKLQNKVFYILVFAIWLISSVYTMIKQRFIDGFIVLAFGSLFLASVYLLQSFFIKRIQKENKVFEKIRKKQK